MKKFALAASLLMIASLFVAFKKEDGNIGLYKIDHSKSGMTWAGKKVIGGHNGTIEIKEGSVNYNGERITSGTFTIDMNTIKSLDLEGEKKEKLENHLKSPDFFDVPKYPLSTFKIKSMEKRANGQIWVTGSLTIKETTRPIDFPVALNVRNGRLEVTAENIKVDRTKYGVVFNSKTLKSSLGNKAIDDEFTIGFSLVLLK